MVRPFGEVSEHLGICVEAEICSDRLLLGQANTDVLLMACFPVSFSFASSGGLGTVGKGQNVQYSNTNNNRNSLKYINFESNLEDIDFGIAMMKTIPH